MAATHTHSSVDPELPMRSKALPLVGNQLYVNDVTELRLQEAISNLKDSSCTFLPGTKRGRDRDRERKRSSLRRQELPIVLGDALWRTPGACPPRTHICTGDGPELAGCNVSETAETLGWEGLRRQRLYAW